MTKDFLPNISTLMTADLEELNSLIISTKGALTKLRPANNDMPETNLKQDPVSPDHEMWEEAKSTLKTQAEMSTELNNRIGQSMLEIMKALLDRTQYIAKLSLPLAEKVAILPVPYVAEPVQGTATLDLSHEPPNESIAWTKAIVDPHTRTSQGSLAAMGGVRGGIVCAGPAEVRSLFYQVEYARHYLEKKEYPRVNSAEINECSKRAEERLVQIQPALHDSNLLVGLQIIYTNQGKLDWIPAIRKK